MTRRNIFLLLYNNLSIRGIFLGGKDFEILRLLYSTWNERSKLISFFCDADSCHVSVTEKNEGKNN